MAYTKKVKFNCLVFECKKCGHLIFVEKEKMKKLLKTECPECKASSDRNWTLLGEGNNVTFDWE